MIPRPAVPPARCLTSWRLATARTRGRKRPSMARRVIILPSAERDLHSLYTYIRDRSGPEVAIGFVRRIRAYCEGFETFPERGRRRDDLRPGLRLVGHLARGLPYW